MKKLFLVLISVLLLTGVANAVEMSQSITAEYAAQNTARSVVSESSVLFQVYYKGTGANPTLNVSYDSVVLWDDGAADLTIDTTTATTDTIGEVVDTINADADWVAVAGPDGYRDYSILGTVSAQANNAIGYTLDAAGSVYKALGNTLSDTSNMLCGVRAQSGVTPRLKGINSSFASNGSPIVIDVYDGNTRIWRKTISNASYVSATAASASPNTVIPVDSAKGLSATKGNSLCVVVSGNTVDTNPLAKVLNQVSITYDKLRD